MTIESTYLQLKENAQNQMKRGDISGYLQTLLKLQQMRSQLSRLLSAKA